MIQWGNPTINYFFLLKLSITLWNALQAELILHFGLWSLDVFVQCFPRKAETEVSNLYFIYSVQCNSSQKRVKIWHLSLQAWNCLFPLQVWKLESDLTSSMGNPFPLFCVHKLQQTFARFLPKKKPTFARTLPSSSIYFSPKFLYGLACLSTLYWIELVEIHGNVGYKEDFRRGTEWRILGGDVRPSLGFDSRGIPKGGDLVKDSWEFNNPALAGLQFRVAVTKV